jgi:hypothetical protein
MFHDVMSYHISHYKDYIKGNAFKRIDGLLSLLPIKHTIHLDAFRYTNESWDLNGHIDMNAELLGCRKIINKFAQYGIDVTTESFDTAPSFAGIISMFWHLYTLPTNKFIRFLMHRKWYGGGAGKYPAEDVVFGASTESDFNGDTTLQEICDEYYLKTLLYHFLRRHEMTSILDDGNRLVVNYGKHCVASYERNSGIFEVTYDKVLIARNDDRFIPINNHEILTYSKNGGIKEWRLPFNWSDKDIKMFMLTELGRESFPDFKISQGKITFQAGPHQPYLITNKKVGEC